jgi:hypothetical protein
LFRLIEVLAEIIDRLPPHREDLASPLAGEALDVLEGNPAVRTYRVEEAQCCSEEMEKRRER